jgi:hypothetical protein
MTFEATWYVFPEDGPVKSIGLVVNTESQVDELVAQLSEHAADTATIHLSESGFFASPPVYDHAVHAAVHGTHGYLSHWDLKNDLAYSSGDPESPALDSENEDFPAGSGIPLADFATALKELLATGQRPTCVSWQPV